MALTSEAQLSTIGKEFWVGFMDNNRILPGASDRAVLEIAAIEDAELTIEYLGNIRSQSLAKGQRFNLIVDSQDLDLFHRFSERVENKGIFISSTGNLSVYAFNERIRSADGTVVLPVAALGKEYLVTSHYERLTAPVEYDGNIDDESSLLVIATEDNTQVEITKSIGGSPIILNLNRGQSYQIKENYDLTGSRVRVIGEDVSSCKKIAVFGGNKWTSVGNCGAANDNLFQQAYPLNTWGQSFTHVGLRGRSSGELVKVLAAENDTDVVVNGTTRASLSATEFVTLSFSADEVVSITTSKPSSVTVFAKSQECNNANSGNFEQGDPFMITYSPNEQLLKEVEFSALSIVSISVNYVNIIVPAGAQGNTILDGRNVGAEFTPVPGNASFFYARISISKGLHSLTNPDGFIAYVYGFGFLESYGYAVGAALDNLNFEVKSSYDFEVQGDLTACLDREGEWSIAPENEDFTYFVWDFNDGSEVKEGQKVNHTFSAPGIYEVTVTASLSPLTCDQQEEKTFQVEVLETKAELLGEQAVCPEVEEFLYKLGTHENLQSVSFEVEGGTILQDYGDSVLVNWGEANPDARIIANPIGTNGCLADPIVLPVVINSKLAASNPVGESAVCFNPLNTHYYEAPNSSGRRGYEWMVSGGEVVSGADQAVVEIRWDQPGITGFVSYTTYSLDDQSCEGTSEPFEVKVAEKLEASISILENVRCAGESSGVIELDIQGGVAPYMFIWPHDADLDASRAENLTPGTYSVLITDSLGCETELDNMVISEPPVLELVSMESEGVSCFGKKDGRLGVAINGGSPPYRLEIDGEEYEFTGKLDLYEVSQGQYDIYILDQNSCSIPLNLEITSPAALEVNVRMSKPACPGGSNGELFAFPEGGEAPYIYYWNEGSAGSNTLEGLAKGTYTLSVVDAFGCVGLGEGEVLENAPEVRLPTGYYPVKDGGFFEGVSNCEIIFTIWIYNRWGQLLYSGTEGWDGKVNGENAIQGTYTYLLQYSFPLEDEIQTVEKRGSFLLVR
ncbi:PKD domain-containing protein [Algoriphagus sp. NG3]|uniref:PKD domain-containing protein n=1 Tax=Algoriphagus sp. NG3 TaxID=3097546 RepID=UPI002A82377A|nr:PKD domain-containing protein [Algoriphagus sp. NG3]WPR76763.1 PKD domain-containing protein [Algoriphagus sp. NG3]